MTLVAEVVEAAYLAGYRDGLTSQAYWEDGQRWVGRYVPSRLETAIAGQKEACREPYRMFLESMRKYKGSDPEPAG